MSPSLRRLLGPRLARTPLQRDTIPLACDDGRVIDAAIRGNAANPRVLEEAAPVSEKNSGFRY